MSKKHKVKIPDGYEVESTLEYNPYDNQGNRWKETHVTFKPIKKELPKTWEEYLTNSSKCYPRGLSNIRIPLDYRHAFDALGKLIELRGIYNDGWEPDWTTNHSKYVILIDGHYISRACATNGSHVLAFRTAYFRDEFLSNFRELIETAKPLL